MTYRTLLQKLKKIGVEDAETEARILACHVMNDWPVARILSENPGMPEEFLLQALDKRAAHIPLQYIIGEWPFYEETYEVRPGCLIPRPDTEILVETAIELLPENCFFSDLCTGSGCVAISVLAHRGDTRAVGVDVDPALVSLALRNASRNGVSERFEAKQGDVLNGDWSGFWNLSGHISCILSNPPYIPSGVIPTLTPEVQHEPVLALDGGTDGLDFYKQILEQGSNLLPKGGLILLEIGADQGPALKALAGKNGYSCEIRKDLSGLDRVCVLKKI